MFISGMINSVYFESFKTIIQSQRILTLIKKEEFLNVEPNLYPSLIL